MADVVFTHAVWEMCGLRGAIGNIGVLSLILTLKLTLTLNLTLTRNTNPNPK